MNNGKRRGWTSRAERFRRTRCIVELASRSLRSPPASTILPERGTTDKESLLCVLVADGRDKIAAVPKTASSSARRLLRQLSIRENRFSAAPSELVGRQPMQFFWIILIDPQEHYRRSTPQRRQRLCRFKNVWRVGKFRAIPEIAAWFMENVHLHPGIEVHRRSLVIFPIDDDDIAGVIVAPHCNGKLVGRQDRRERAERGVNARQQAHHHDGKNSVAERRTSAPPQHPIQSGSQQQPERHSNERTAEGAQRAGRQVKHMP